MEPTCERTVVVGVDGSPEALVAARWAVWQAALRGLDVQLVYSYPLPLMDAPVCSSFFDDFAEAGRTVLAEALGALEVPPAVAVSTLVAETLPTLLMQRLSRTAVLVVVGQHATAWYDRLGRGSVVSPLAHHAGCPVVVVPPTWRQGGDDGRPVVVAVDGEATAAAALDLAFDEAAMRGAEVVALHADAGRTPEQTEAAERDVAALLARARAGRPATPARVVAVRGDASKVILAAAQSAALLVVGPPHTEGRTTWTRSVARHVLTTVECPLVVMPRHRSGPGSPVLTRSDVVLVAS